MILVKESCKVKISSIQLKNQQGADVLGNYELTLVDGVCHAFGEWTVGQAPTSTEDGYRERICECGKKEIETLLATGNSAEPGEKDSESFSSDKATDSEYENDGDNASGVGCFGSMQTSLMGAFTFAVSVLFVAKRRKEN